MKAYSDADFSSDIDQPKRQGVTALSTAEAKYINIC